MSLIEGEEMIKYSIYQQAIIDVYTTTNQNIVIEAAPGSGKTFMLCELAKKTPISKQSLFCCFNKSIATELGSKLPFHMKAMTLHSLGMRTLLKYHGINLTVQEDKTFILCKKIVDYKGIERSKQNQYMYTLCQLVNLYRINTLSKAEELIEVGPQYDLVVSDKDVKNVETIMEYLNEYNRNLTGGSYIDFTDMLWLCKDLPSSAFQKYDVVFFDECQDANLLQMNMIEKVIKPNGRFVIVGDKKQCIYSFAGASLEVFQKFENKPNTTVLPLSVTYRCAKKITAEANTIFNEMESFAELPEGEVKRKGCREEIEEGDYVLCRNNRPLVEMYIYLLSNHKKANIYGRDYGEQLVKMLSGLEDCSLEEVKTNLDEKRNLIIQQLMEKGFQNPQLHPKVGKFDEIYSILCLLFEIVDSVPETIEKINQMFTNKLNEGVTLMTIHRSKGLENNRVFFLCPKLIPSPYANSHQLLYSERCLYYVAVTRAKNTLVYLE